MFDPPSLLIYCWRKIRRQRNEQTKQVRSFLELVSYELPDDKVWTFTECRRCMADIVIQKMNGERVAFYCKDCRQEKIRQILMKSDTVYQSHAQIEFTLFKFARVPCILCRMDFSTHQELLVKYEVCLSCLEKEPQLQAIINEININTKL